MLLLLALAACAPSPPDFGGGGTSFHDLVFDDGDTGQGDTGQGESQEHDPHAWLEDRWTPTYEICAPPEPLLMHQDSYFDISEACKEAMNADLSVDVDAFLAVDNGQAALNSFHLSMWHLVGRDLGPTEDLLLIDTYLADWIHPDAVAALQAAGETLGQQDLRPVRYNFITSVVETTTFVEHIPLSETTQAVATFNIDSRTMTLTKDMPYLGPYYNGAMLHEAAHGWFGSHHVVCPDDPDQREWCDDTWDSPNGLAAASCAASAAHLNPDSEFYGSYLYEAELCAYTEASRVNEDRYADTGR